ncbi:MAG: EAL domain-containing protein [Gammaproteobacteria bacterium]|nr:EAL domain-containing protein [Gammaproteobacteria bacterium]
MAKDAGRNQVQILDIEDERVKRSRQDLLQLNQILNAIDESRFLLYFQSIVPLQKQDNPTKLIEIQVRMDTDDGEILSRDEFNPLVQQYHLQSHLDKWMLREITRLFYDNAHELESTDLCMLQISDESLKDESFRSFVDELLQDNPLLGKRLCFEINESAANSSFELTNLFIEKLKNHHVSFALDEFGTSHSSSEHLDSLNVDYLKINGALVKDLLNSPCDMATVKSILDVGIKSEKAIIAEMVESEETEEYLTDIGVAYAQGDLYTKAAPLLANKSNAKTVDSEKNSSIEADFQQELDQAV